MGHHQTVLLPIQWTLLFSPKFLLSLLRICGMGLGLGLGLEMKFWAIAFCTP